MNFTEAVDSMVDGNMVIRKNWQTGYALAILPKQTYIWSIAEGGSNPVINASIYIPKIDDIYATDWQIKTK